MSLPILTYHRVLAGTPDKTADPHRIAVSQQQFRRHLAWLKRLGFRTLRLDDYVRTLRRGQEPPPRTFAITFDDGYEDVLTRGLPVLQEFGFTATVFAVAGELAGVNRWDDGDERLMSAVQYRQWAHAGMSVGAHTCRHAHLTRIDADEARREIADSKHQLEEAIAQPVPLFAYPYGEYSDAVEALVRDAGFEAAFATDRAPVDHAEQLYHLRRAVIFPRNTTWEVLVKAQPWYSAYQDWKRRGRA